MSFAKEQRKASEHSGDKQEAAGQGKDPNCEQSPGTGYNSRKAPDANLMKNSISRRKWEH